MPRDAGFAVCATLGALGVAGVAATSVLLMMRAMSAFSMRERGKRACSIEEGAISIAKMAGGWCSCGDAVVECNTKHNRSMAGILPECARCRTCR
eukprot:3365234-Amphidinium_carterae.1